jgi:hypothetical protein
MMDYTVHRRSSHHKEKCIHFRSLNDRLNGKYSGCCVKTQARNLSSLAGFDLPPEDGINSAHSEIGCTVIFN